MHLRPVGSRLTSSAHLHHRNSFSSEWEDLSDTITIILTCLEFQGSLVALILGVQHYFCVCGDGSSSSSNSK